MTIDLPIADVGQAEGSIDLSIPVKFIVRTDNGGECKVTDRFSAFLNTAIEASGISAARQNVADDAADTPFMYEKYNYRFVDTPSSELGEPGHAQVFLTTRHVGVAIWEMMYRGVEVDSDSRGEVSSLLGIQSSGQPMLDAFFDGLDVRTAETGTEFFWFRVDRDGSMGLEGFDFVEVMRQGKRLHVGRFVGGCLLNSTIRNIQPRNWLSWDPF